MSKNKNQNSKKNKKIYTNKKKEDITYNVEIKKLLKIIGIILIVFVVIYFFIGIFITKEIKLFGNNKDDSGVVTSTIQYEEILAGETFNMPKDEYYVIYSSSKGNYYSIYKSMISSKTDKTIYIVDLDNPLNLSYVSEESNPAVQNAANLKLKDNTLIKINNKQNTEYIEGKDQILSYFK